MANRFDGGPGSGPQTGQGGSFPTERHVKRELAQSAAEVSTAKKNIATIKQKIEDTGKRHSAEKSALAKVSSAHKKEIDRKLGNKLAEISARHEKRKAAINQRSSERMAKIRAGRS